MPKVAITVSDAFLAEIDAYAEKDAPGAPNRSATALRLLAQGLEVERERRPLPRIEPPPRETSAQPRAGASKAKAGR